MNRKLILGALVVGALIGTVVSCTVTQPPEGCAVESGGAYWARYTITQKSGNCAFLQTYDTNGNVITDSSGNWLAAEEIDVQAYGPAVPPPPTTVQETAGFFLLNGGTYSIGTLGSFNTNYCAETGISQAVGTAPDPNFAPFTPPTPDAGPPPPDSGPTPDAGSVPDAGPLPDAGPVADAGPVDAGPPFVPGPQDTCQVCAQNADCMSGNCNLTAALITQTDGGTVGFCDVAVGGSCANASDCGANGGTCDPTDTTCGCAAPNVQVTYSFSNIQFEQAYSILGKQFHGSLQYDQVPVGEGFGASECHATITVDAVQYNDNAAGAPGHLQGNHCEMDTTSDAVDCTAHAGAYGFPVDTGWICMPLLDQPLYYPSPYAYPETYEDGGTVEPLPDGGTALIPAQRCVPKGAVPIGAAND